MSRQYEAYSHKSKPIADARFYGITSLQSIHYFNSYAARDRWALKTLVCHRNEICVQLTFDTLVTCQISVLLCVYSRGSARDNKRMLMFTFQGSSTLSSWSCTSMLRITILSSTLVTLRLLEGRQRHG